MYINKDMKMMDEQSDNAYTICYDDIPLTVPIADKSRADLAYSVLHVMAENEALVKLHDDIVPMFASNISIKDKYGNEVEPVCDPEWFEKGGDEKAREAALDKQIEEGLANGTLHPDYYMREFEANLQEQYTICSFDDDRCRMRFAPEVWDVDKAGEMQNLMTYGMQPSIALFYRDNSDEFAEIKGHISIINEDGEVLSDQLNENWAHEIMINDDQDFADAVASIPETEQGMEQ